MRFIRLHLQEGLVVIMGQGNVKMNWDSGSVKIPPRKPIEPKLSYSALRAMMDDTLNDMRRPIGKEYLKALEELHVALCKVAKFN